MNQQDIEEVLNRHEDDRIALQFSGGKDSLCVLHMFKPFWDRLTVYHLDSGDENPEVTRLVDQVAQDVPNFVKIQSDVLEMRRRYGLPTDVMPWTGAHAAHTIHIQQGPMMQDRMLCCYNNIMVPLHRRMEDDQITLIIRGQKIADTYKGPLMSGTIVDKLEVLFPIETWKDDQVFSYLDENRVPYPDYYREGLIKMADCLTCTAWAEDRRGEYLRLHFPDKYDEYMANLLTITQETYKALTGVTRQLMAGYGDVRVDH